MNEIHDRLLALSEYRQEISFRMWVAMFVVYCNFQAPFINQMSKAGIWSKLIHPYFVAQPFLIISMLEKNSYY